MFVDMHKLMLIAENTLLHWAHEFDNFPCIDNILTPRSRMPDTDRKHKYVADHVNKGLADADNKKRRKVNGDRCSKSGKLTDSRIDQQIKDQTYIPQDVRMDTQTKKLVGARNEID